MNESLLVVDVELLVFEVEDVQSLVILFVDLGLLLAELQEVCLQSLTVPSEIRVPTYFIICLNLMISVTDENKMKVYPETFFGLEISWSLSSSSPLMCCKNNSSVL